MPRTRQGVLAATLLQPDRWWYLSDLAGFLGVRPSSLQRELSQLAEAGILERRRDGGRVYYRADADCPFLEDLQGLLIKTVGLVDKLCEALSPHAERIRLAMIYGSVARGEELSRSDVDLLIVGDVGLSELAIPLRRAEKQIGREINPSVYSEAEVVRRLAAGDHFLCSLMNERLISVIGDSDELEQLAAAAASEGPRDEQEGGGRPSRGGRS